MTWHASLKLDYALAKQKHAQNAPKTVAYFEHNGPLRILQSLYPEGDAVCHNVVVHPPGGLVGGDTLNIDITVAPGAHALITTPGATRFYRSDGAPALQAVHAKLQDGARLEWLPLEALAYSGCIAQNRSCFELASTAEMMAWDVTALGLPQANLPFERGSFSQHIELPGHWLERARIDAADTVLMDGPLGLAGHRCLGTLFFATGSSVSRTRREAALETARAVIAAHPLQGNAGVTAPNPHVIVLRVLAPLVEPAMGLLRQVWNVWRHQLWGLQAGTPRIWSV